MNQFYASYSNSWVRIFGANCHRFATRCRPTIATSDLRLARTARQLIVSCLDNLIKGAAGQAVQNMNVMYGWAEQEGLN